MVTNFVATYKVGERSMAVASLQCDVSRFTDASADSCLVLSCLVLFPAAAVAAAAVGGVRRACLALNGP